MAKFLVKCNKCGIEFKTRLWIEGDKHKKDDCNGEFIVVKIIES